MVQAFLKRFALFNRHSQLVSEEVEDVDDPTGGA